MAVGGQSPWSGYTIVRSLEKGQGEVKGEAGGQSPGHYPTGVVHGHPVRTKNTAGGTKRRRKRNERRKNIMRGLRLLVGLRGTSPTPLPLPRVWMKMRTCKVYKGDHECVVDKQSSRTTSDDLKQL
jgi:hypothetical protein